jgi:hypothetical protein
VQPPWWLYNFEQIKLARIQIAIIDQHSQWISRFDNRIENRRCIIMLLNVLIVYFVAKIFALCLENLKINTHLHIPNGCTNSGIFNAVRTSDIFR